MLYTGVVCYLFIIRSTPVEILHTLLLGLVKYMLREFMQKRSAAEKADILARVYGFPYCGFSTRITTNIRYHYKSFVGRDFKAFLQMAVFIVTPFISEQEKVCWFLLSKASRLKYLL